MTRVVSGYQKFFPAILLALCVVLIPFQFTCSAQIQKAKITPPTWPYTGIGYYQYLPPGYDKSTEKFPVLFFFHGIGEKGNGTTQLSKVLIAGPPKLISQGHQFPFIVISPQLKPIFEDWYPWYMDEVVEYVKKTLRIDETRIYVSGLSLGGGGAWMYGEHFPEKVAALAPICGHYNNPEVACTAFVKNNIPIWAFHGEIDNTIPLYRTQFMINSLLECLKTTSGTPPIFTIYKNVGHKGAWENAYRTDHLLHNPNLYEWMLQQQKIKVNAGQDIILKLPHDTLTLTGIMNPSVGNRTDVRYKWTKIDGPAVTISHASELTVSLSDMSQGMYVFRFTVTTSSGESRWDDINVLVSGE